MTLRTRPFALARCVSSLLVLAGCGGISIEEPREPAAEPPAEQDGLDAPTGPASGMGRRASSGAGGTAASGVGGGSAVGESDAEDAGVGGGNDAGTGGAGDAAEPPPGGAGGTSVAGASDCADVCATLTECRGEAIPECEGACLASAWVDTHNTRCLSLRIYWIDEEGCESMLATYDAFRANDRCDD